MKEKYATVTLLIWIKLGKWMRLKILKQKYLIPWLRVSIWKSAWELSLKNLPFGVGASDGKPELVNYYKQTNQHFLAKYEFPTHNQFLDFLLKYGILGPISCFFLYFHHWLFGI